MNPHKIRWGSQSRKHGTTPGSVVFEDIEVGPHRLQPVYWLSVSDDGSLSIQGPRFANPRAKGVKQRLCSNGSRIDSVYTSKHRSEAAATKAAERFIAAERQAHLQNKLTALDLKRAELIQAMGCQA